jgi:adenosylcobyric acid synthase
MALNSWVTPDGGEIGRAQVLQAEACQIVPSTDMNPVLLKPESDCTSQVIVRGTVWKKLEAQSYLSLTQELWPLVRDSYDRLARDYEVIVIEGAGSAAELNLLERDIVNWPVVHWADAAVLLVGDIDRGGIFAQIIGTIDLLTPEDRRRIMGIVVNKFRGDLRLFDEGAALLERKTGLPILGVVPFLRNLLLDQEDSVEIEKRRSVEFHPSKVNIAVVLLPHMSNFTDFNLLAAEEDVALRYVKTASELTGADAAILPGTKNTIGDLAYLKAAGFAEALQEYVARRGELIGICGGFQMLGHSVADPLAVEVGGVTEGFGYLAVSTELTSSKTLSHVIVRLLDDETTENILTSGYEIHMGQMTGVGVKPRFQVIQTSNIAQGGSPTVSDSLLRFEGGIDDNGLVWGSHIHGLFDNPSFRRHWLNQVRARKRLPKIADTVSHSVNARRSSELDRWADHLETHMTCGPLWSLFPELRSTTARP